MHDIRFIREDADGFDRALGRRGLDPMAAGILDLDKTRRALITELQELQERRNTASKEIGTIKQSGGDADALVQEVATIKSRMTDIEAEEKLLGERSPTC